MKVAVYARVSTEDQQEKGTIENQIEFARKYIDLHQLDVTEWYKDDGVTGTIPLDERDEGHRTMEDARASKYQQLLVYKLDRLGRSARIILNAVYELEQAGITVKSMTEPFDTGDPAGRFLLTILAGVADLERETILNRMWHGANRAARAGKWLGGIVPYGYCIDENKFLVISNEPLPNLTMSEADIVRLIYNLVTEHRLSTTKIADYFNALNIPPSYIKDGRKIKRGKRKETTAGIWHPSRIRNMIINETYKGIHFYGKRTNKKRELISREVPAIVSGEIWDKAQNALINNRLESVKNSIHRQYLLRGLLKCDTCGLTFSGTNYNGPGGKLKAYYVCNGKTSYKGRILGKCTSKNVPAAWLESIIWLDILDFVENPGRALDEMAATIENKKQSTTNLIEDKTLIIQAIKEKDVEKQTILDLFRKKLITQADVEVQLEKIMNEKQALEERLSETKNQVQDNFNIKVRFDTIRDTLLKIRERINDELTFEEKRDIVKILVSEVSVYTENGDGNGGNKISKKKAKVSIIYNFSKDINHTDTGSSKPPS